MKKDGTVYLTYARFNNDEERKWDLIHWGEAIMTSPPRTCWCNQMNLALKVKNIAKFIELSTIVGFVFGK